jgi:hypothetical protein
MNRLSLKGKFHLELFRGGVKLKVMDFSNAITNEGLNELLNVMFHGGTQTLAWYLGLIDSAGFVQLASSDTMASHVGWAESVIYYDSERMGWVNDVASSQQITNSVPVTFLIETAGTVKGIFVTSDITKGGTSGTLWSTGLFSSDVSVLTGDTIKITYTVTASVA